MQRSYLVADTMTRDVLKEAEVLLNAGYVRAAGALAGVMLERHLKRLCNRQNPQITYPGKATISKLNDLLKDVAYDAIAWRKVQVLVNIRTRVTTSALTSRGPTTSAT